MKENNSALHEITDMLNTRINRNIVDSTIAVAKKQDFIGVFSIINDLINKEEYTEAIKIITQIQKEILSRDKSKNTKLFKALNMRKTALQIYNIKNKKEYEKIVLVDYDRNNETYNYMMKLHAKYHNYS